MNESLYLLLLKKSRWKRYFERAREGAPDRPEGAPDGCRLAEGATEANVSPLSDKIHSLFRRWKVWWWRISRTFSVTLRGFQNSRSPPSPSLRMWVSVRVLMFLAYISGMLVTSTNERLEVQVKKTYFYDRIYCRTIVGGWYAASGFKYITPST